MSQIYRLRADGSYRGYVRGLRLLIIGFLTVIVSGGLGAAGLYEPIVAILVAVGFASGFVGLLMAVISWIHLQENQGVIWPGQGQIAFIRILVSDIFRGVAKSDGKSLGE